MNKKGKRQLQLGLKVNYHDSQDFSEAAIHQFTTPHRRKHYKFLFVTEGNPIHMVDMQQITLSPGQVLFVLPDQLHFQLSSGPARFYKIGFHASCLSLLPRQYHFLINPFQLPYISLDKHAQQRVNSLFNILLQMLDTLPATTAPNSASAPAAPAFTTSLTPYSPADLVLSYLNALLTEWETGYFAAYQNRTDNKGTTDRKGKIDRFIAFKQQVESRFTDTITVTGLAADLGLSAVSLHKLVKHYAGMPPKDYINRRIILEAQRMLYYDPVPVKELTYRLGLSDPDYFSRLFKKVAGKTISEFLAGIASHRHPDLSSSPQGTQHSSKEKIA